MAEFTQCCDLNTPILSYFSRSHWKDCTRWTKFFFFPIEKATLFLVYFLRAFPLKPPRVLAIEDWAVCMGKCTSAVSLPNQIEFWCRACVFLRRKKRGSSCLCNWRMGKGVEAHRLGDYGKMSLSCTFSSLISHFAILLDYISRLSLNIYSEFSKTAIRFVFCQSQRAFGYSTKRTLPFTTGIQ